MEPRSRSRSPLRQRNQFHRRASPTPSNVSVSSSTSNISVKDARRKEGKFCLKFNSVPLYWRYPHVTKYIKNHTHEIDPKIASDISFVEQTPGLQQFPGTQCSIVFFNTQDSRNQAFEILKQTKDRIDGRKLFVNKCSYLGSKIAADKSFEGKFQKPNMAKGSQMKFPYGTTTPVNTETYGLSVDFLKELEIHPPLTSKVFVRYVPARYNDEEKVRSLFGQAGNIISVTILVKPLYINVRIEYDHPVEAVQAVAMFNNRELYDKQLKCEMDRVRKVWNEGMPIQGPGLGPNGTPMKGVRVCVEVKKLKTELTNEIQKITATIEDLKAEVMSLQTSNATKIMTGPLPNAPNPLLNAASSVAANQFASLGNLITKQLQPIQLLQSLMQSNAGNDLALLGNALQTITGSNLGNILQQTLPNQGVSNVQGSPNMQPGNMQSGHNNLLLGLNNMQVGPNNVQNGHNNMQSGSNNMQNELNNMQSGSKNMQGGHNMQSGHFNMQSGPSNEMAPSSMQSGLNNMQSGSQNMQHGKQDVFGSTNSSYSNIQSGQPYNNMQSGYGVGSNEQMITGFGGPQSDYYNTGRQEIAGNTSTMLLFQNLPVSVTLPALQSKMREVGKVKFIQITGPGRAIVNFLSDHDADKCIRLFNQSKVDGQIIEVKKM